MSDTRQHAHQLIDRMPEAQLSGLVQFLETIVDPVATALRNAPLDEEPETDEEKAAVAEALRGYRSVTCCPQVACFDPGASLEPLRLYVPVTY